MLLIIASVLVCGMLFYDLNRRNGDLDRLAREVEAKEAQTAGVQFPSAAEQREWSLNEELFERVMLGDESVPLLFAEITRIGSENNLQRMGINTEEHTTSEPASSDRAAPGNNAALLAAGVNRYSAVTIRFQGTYSDTARFVDSISRLPYSVSIQSIDLRRAQPLPDATIVLHVYKRGPA
jgi:Tfp pilus assembly protein PilO